MDNPYFNPDGSQRMEADPGLMSALIKKFRPDVIRSDSQPIMPLDILGQRAPNLKRMWDREAEVNRQPPEDFGVPPEVLLQIIRKQRSSKIKEI